MRPRVLVIDDSPDIHTLLEARLRAEELDLVHAYDGEQGIAAAVANLPDLILLDVDMPGLTGFEACQRLKADTRTGQVPIIFLTGADELYAKVQGFDLGAVDYVTKPFQPAELRARVRAVLRTKRYQDMLATRAQVDGLTGLWNRSYFERRLEEETSAARRYRRKVSLAMVDIDHFKAFNDRFGHPFGDLVLQRVGEALTTTLRTTDAACRYGGEEFGLIFTETSRADALIACRRVCAAIRAIQLGREGERVSVTVSVGLAGVEQVDDLTSVTRPQIIDAADAALYAAKRAGRDRIELADWPGLAPLAHAVG
jgi:diguanylate cyclase (GGDEF)-like protein